MTPRDGQPKADQSFDTWKGQGTGCVQNEGLEFDSPDHLRGNMLIHTLNGHAISLVVDDDLPNRATEGLIVCRFMSVDR
jgi:hypothetical protein